MTTSLLFLGYIISVEGIRVKEEKVRTIKYSSAPTIIHQVQA